MNDRKTSGKCRLRTFRILAPRSCFSKALLIGSRYMNVEGWHLTWRKKYLSKNKVILEKCRYEIICLLYCHDWVSGSFFMWHQTMWHPFFLLKISFPERHCIQITGVSVSPFAVPWVTNENQFFPFWNVYWKQQIGNGQQI